MKEPQHNKRFLGALIVTAFLTVMLVIVAQYTGASASEVRDISAPAHETHVEGTRTSQPGETRTPEATRTQRPHETESPEGTEPPHESRTPEQTRTPEASRTPEETRTPRSTGTPCVDPTESLDHGGHCGPEPSRTPESTGTPCVDPTEGMDHGGHCGPEPSHTPEASRTPCVDPTESLDHGGHCGPEPSRTPRGTEPPHPSRTPEGTEPPEETRTPHATRTVFPPSPIPTGQVPVSNNNPSSTGASVPGTGSRLFPETGKVVNGVFLTYWDGNGGLTQQGFPISNVVEQTSPLDGKVYTTQYFQRSMFEYHPENAAPYNILLSQLGTFRYNQKYPNGAPNQVANKTNGQYFPQTGHWIGGDFLAYWKQNGGLAQQGYPISEQFTEISSLDGKPYTVQYFERSVFELHPENKAPYNILLSQLGTFQYEASSAK